jgi:putrescine aminotransferase
VNAPIRNYDIAELRRQDLAHHLPAQADHKLIAEMGGSRIITRADGCVIHDGDGNAILDGMAGLWCVNVGYGRTELAQAAYDQMLELPYYNTFFKTASPPPIQLGAAGRLVEAGDVSADAWRAAGGEAADAVRDRDRLAAARGG